MSLEHNFKSMDGLKKWAKKFKTKTKKENYAARARYKFILKSKVKKRIFTRFL